MNDCIFTICAKNYIGLAQILEQSIKKSNPGIDFFIFIADELSSNNQIQIPANAIECRKALGSFLDASKWEEMAFKYDITEFCTSIKPYCFKYLFDKRDYKKAIYLDPDIYVFSSLETLFTQLERYKILLTPHIVLLEDKYSGERSESGLLSTGMYNLGFLALSSCVEVDKMLRWWGERLKNQCFVDVLDNYFTDQRWMDFLTCFFNWESLLVLRDLGFNLAPWNFFEREVFWENDVIQVKARKSEENGSSPQGILYFAHFSGYNYLEMMKGNFNINLITNLHGYDDLKIIFGTYSSSLEFFKNNFSLYLQLPYSYQTFHNGVFIKHFHRRIFRSLVEEGQHPSSPFSFAKDSFYDHLKRNKLLGANKKDDVNKIQRSNFDVAGKLKQINIIMRLVLKVVGLEKYILLLRLMQPYSKIENQLFLYNKQYIKLK